MTVIGIDLGTTYSAAAVSDDGLSARVLPTQEGQATTPSVVFFPKTETGKDEPLVGAMAKNSAAGNPESVVQFIKRMMGDPTYRYISPNGNEFRPEEVSAIILKHIKQYAELDLGEPVNDAVITVPAYFDDARRTATKQAGAIAGFNVLQVFNEPTAAAIAYGLQSRPEGMVLVYDLGGGTFDVTLMHVHDGVFDVIATDGDPELGGIDFDREIARLITEDLASQGYVVDEFEDDLLMAEIDEKAEIIKRGLSNVAQSTAIFTIQGKTYRVRITRDAFERATETLLRRTQERVELLMQGQRLSWDQVDELLIIGGSTRMPMVRAMLERISGKSVKHEIDPDAAVAEGAAIYARLLAEKESASTYESALEIVPYELPDGSQILVSDVTSQSLGVIANNDEGKPYNAIIIRNNTKIPAKASDTFFTVVDGQASVLVRVTEGNDDDLEYVKVVGEKELPIPPHPKGSPVQVTFAYDIDQTVYVEVVDLTDDHKLGTFEVDRASNLQDSQVKSLKSKIDAMPVE